MVAARYGLKKLRGRKNLVASFLSRIMCCHMTQDHTTNHATFRLLCINKDLPPAHLYLTELALRPPSVFSASFRMDIRLYLKRKVVPRVSKRSPTQQMAALCSLRSRTPGCPPPVPLRLPVGRPWSRDHLSERPRSPGWSGD